MLTTGVVQYLLAQTDITANVANGNCIMPIPAPADISLYPCITYQVASDTVDAYTLADGEDNLNKARIVFDCFVPTIKGGSYLKARYLALAIKKALSGYSGTLSDGTRVFIAEIVNASDGFQNDAMLSRSTVHVMFTYQT